MMIRKVCLLFFFFLLFNASMFAQENDEEKICDNAKLTVLWNTVLDRLNTGSDFEYLAARLKDVIECSEYLNNDELWARSHIFIAQSYFLLKDFENQAKYLDSLGSNLDSLNIKNQSYKEIKADYYYLQGKRYKVSGFPERANYTYVKAMDILLELAGKTKDSEIDYNNLGYNFSFNIVGLINEIAILHYKLGDYDSSVEYYNVALKLAELPMHQFSFNANQVIVLYMNLGDAYLQKGNMDLSKYYFDKALSLPVKNKYENKVKRNRWTHLYKGLALYHSRKNELDSAIVYLNKGLSIEQDIESEIKLLRAKGEIYKNKSQYDISEKSAEEAISKTESHLGYFHTEMVLNYMTLAEIKYAKGEYDKSNKLFNRAINILLSKKTDELDFKEIEVENILHKRMSLEIANGKVKVLKKLDLSKETIKCYQFIHDNIFELQQKVILNDNSKFYLIEKSKAIYEDAIDTALKIGNAKEAYRFSQLSKSMLLLQQIQEKEAIQISSLPVDITFNLQELKMKIDKSQKNKSTSILLGNQKDIDKIETEIFDLNAQYRKLMTEIENDYPAYYNLKYNIPSNSIQEIQEQLKKKKSTLVEYFLGEKHLYTFVLDGDSIQVSKEKIRENLFDDIRIMTESIQKYNGIHASFENFNRTSYALYKLLFENIENENWIKTKNLIIIPDEQLNLIPFEALLSEKMEFNDTMPHYHQLNYLIKDYDISYTYSSNLIRTNRNKSNNEFLGIAPTFKNLALKNLDHNVEEVVNLKKIHSGENLLEENATYDQFINKIKGKGIVHFATHAIFNDRIPLDSRIELADTSLYIYEIFSMEHNLQLAVMSACQTASGEQRKGEGVVSLARAFFQSGCPSIVASLWDVSDQKAVGIMKDFHQNLRNGKTKNNALAEAKRNYLSNAISRNTHPFYWAGFIQMGDVTPIDTNSFNYWYLLIILVLILVLFIVLTKKVRKKIK